MVSFILEAKRLKNHFLLLLVTTILICIVSLIANTIAIKNQDSNPLKWQTSLNLSPDEHIEDNLGLDFYNNIYVPISGIPGKNSARLISINPNGIIKWEFSLRNYSISKPIIDKDNNIYIYSSPSLYAFSHDGKLLWEIESLNNLCNIALGSNQILYATDCTKGADYKKIWAIRLDGSIFWSERIENNAKMAINQNNDIISFHSNRITKENFLININGSNGTTLWKNLLGDSLISTSSLSIMPDQSFLVNLKTSLLSVKKNGQINWEIKPIQIINPPLIDKDGMIYAYNNLNNTLIAFDQTGKEKWKIEKVISDPLLIDHAENLYFYTAEGMKVIHLPTFDPETKNIQDLSIPYSKFTPVIASEGTIYSIYQDDLVAYKGANSLSTHGWPKKNHDNQNTNCSGSEISPPPPSINVRIELVIGQSIASVNDFPQKVDPPFLYNNRSYIPFRFLAEALGAKASFTVDPTTNLVNTVSYETQKMCISLWINQKDVLINGTNFELDSPPIIRMNRCYVPIRFVSESLGAKVTWNSTTKSISIVYENE